MRAAQIRTGISLIIYRPAKKHQSAGEENETFLARIRPERGAQNEIIVKTGEFTLTDCEKIYYNK